MGGLRGLVLTAIGALAGVTTWSAPVLALPDTVDFGIIREAEGPKTVRIFVRNEGTEPAAILKVRPTCGCTAADFRQDAFAPGGSAWIDLTYDPYRRPGRFEKGVKIYPVDGEMVRVPITGVVFSSPETVEAMFPVDAGLLHLSESTLMTLSPLKTEKRTLWINVYNSGDDPVRLWLESDEPAVDTQPFPSPLAPGEKGLIGVYLDPALEERIGNIVYDLTLRMNAGDREETFPIKLYTEKP